MTQIMKIKMCKILITMVLGSSVFEKADAILLFLDPKGSFNNLKKPRSLRILKPLKFAVSSTTISNSNPRVPTNNGKKSKQNVDLQ